jgi:molecular chaperone DnaK (HSP70)
MTSVAIGLDIGTSNCCVCIARPHPSMPAVPTVEVVPSTSGGHLTPSYVAFTDDRTLVGDAAKCQQADNPRRTFYEFKRVLGLAYNAQGLWNKHWTFCVSQSSRQPGTPVFTVVDANQQLKEYTAFDLYAILINHLLERARSRLAQGESIGTVTVTVPAHFDANQRKQTKQATEKALKTFAAQAVVRVLDEPIAAVTAYLEQGRLDFQSVKRDQRVMVFDLGGGTLDVTLLRPNSSGGLDVCATEGKSDLGGIDFDTAILDHVCKMYQKQKRRDLRIDKPLLAQARRASEEAKITLSSQSSTTITVGDVSIAVTRDEFAKWIEKHLRQASHLTQATLDQQKAQASQVSHVIVVGGSSQVPAVRGMIGQFFSPHAVSVRDDVNPTESVAQGAAVHAFRHLNAPAAAAAVDADRDVKPAIKVSPTLTMSLGIQIRKDVMHVLLPKNTMLPCSASLPIYPCRQNQTQATVRVFQGPHSLTTAAGMARLGTVTIPLAQQGESLLLRLKIDTNGVLRVTLTNSATGKDVSRELKFS